MNSRLSEIIKTQDPADRYKDCEGFKKLASVEKTPAKKDKEQYLCFRIFKIAWGEVSLN